MPSSQVAHAACLSATVRDAHVASRMPDERFRPFIRESDERIDVLKVIGEKFLAGHKRTHTIECICPRI